MSELSKRMSNVELTSSELEAALRSQLELATQQCVQFENRVRDLDGTNKVSKKICVTACLINNGGGYVSKCCNIGLGGKYLWMFGMNDNWWWVWIFLLAHSIVFTILDLRLDSIGSVVPGVIKVKG